jgi:hypothetical protein
MDGSGSGRLRLVRPIRRMRRCGRSKQGRHQYRNLAQLLGRSETLEALGHAILRRAGLILVTAGTIIMVGWVLHHGGTVLHGRSGYTAIAVNCMGDRVRHCRAGPCGAGRPCRNHRRESDRDRNQHREHGAKQLQLGDTPATIVKLTAYNQDKSVGETRQITVSACSGRPARRSLL